MKKKILILNYGTGNINSIKNTFQKFDCDVQVGDTTKSINLAEIIILPGVGTFPDSIGLLKQKLIFNYLKKIAKKGKNILGICLGMQILSNSSTEIKKTKGLKLISGDTKKVFAPHHIGWNSVTFQKKSIFEDLSHKDFYFQHQFCVENSKSKEKAFFSYGKNKYTALIKNKNIIGVQFHPEKSQKVGLDFIKIYLDNVYA